MGEGQPGGRVSGLHGLKVVDRGPIMTPPPPAPHDTSLCCSRALVLSAYVGRMTSGYRL